MSTPESAPPETGRRFLRGRRLVAALGLLAVLSLAGLGVAGLIYQRYAAVWARTPSRPPTCVLATRLGLRRTLDVSGTEPHDTIDGTTVYVRPNEDRVLRCVSTFSKDLSRHFASAFSELEPERRALMLFKAVRDGVPRDPAHDREAVAGFLLASAAMRALPDLPEVKAASEELRLLNACRFQTRIPCPSRPPIPVTVWLAGGPSAAGILIVLGFAVKSAAVRAREAWRRRRERKSPSAQ